MTVPKFWLSFNEWFDHHYPLDTLQGCPDYSALREAVLPDYLAEVERLRDKPTTDYELAFFRSLRKHNRTFTTEFRNGEFVLVIKYDPAETDGYRESAYTMAELLDASLLQTPKGRQASREIRPSHVARYQRMVHEANGGDPMTLVTDSTEAEELLTRMGNNLGMTGERVANALEQLYEALEDSALPTDGLGDLIKDARTSQVRH